MGDFPFFPERKYRQLDLRRPRDITAIAYACTTSSRNRNEPSSHYKFLFSLSLLSCARHSSILPPVYCTPCCVGEEGREKDYFSKQKEKGRASQSSRGKKVNCRLLGLFWLLLSVDNYFRKICPKASFFPMGSPHFPPPLFAPRCFYFPRPPCSLVRGDFRGSFLIGNARPATLAIPSPPFRGYDLNWRRHKYFISCSTR